MRHLPPLNTLRVFEAAARRLNFSAAAEELCVTHSAVSHQMRQLETWLGQALFVRHAGGVRLTAAGQSLLQAASQALETLENCCTALQHAPLSSEITLGAPGSFLAHWLIPRLDRFEARYPQLRLRLQTSTTLDDLLQQRLDAQILASDHWPQQVVATPLFDEQIGPVCAPHWPALASLKQARDLLGQPLLHTASRLNAWPEWAQLQQLDPHQFTQGRQFDHLPLMLEAAIAGLGIAIAPALLVEREIALGRLVAPLGFVASYAVFALCTTQKQAQESALLTLRDWLLSEP